jgi:1-acyl-sn-glycerol-3-phosphate acyltransferase
LNVVLFLLRAVFVVIWMLLGLLLVLSIFRFFPSPYRLAINRQWSRVLMCLCGVRIRVLGEPRLQGPALWVANHVSWLDVFVLNTVRPTAFVAKSEIRNWPLLGWLVAGSGTVFIERGQRHAVRRVGHQMQARFKEGGAIGLFPEGTTSSGLDVGPFHSSLFDAAIRSHVDIQPVALRFFHRGRRSDYVAFVGEQSLLQNLWRLLGTTGVAVELEFPPAMDGEFCEEHGRSSVAAHAHHVIRQAVVVREAGEVARCS